MFDLPVPPRKEWVEMILVKVGDYLKVFVGERKVTVNAGRARQLQVLLLL